MAFMKPSVAGVDPLAAALKRLTGDDDPLLAVKRLAALAKADSTPKPERNNA